LDFDLDSQFWLNNLVANKVYGNWEGISPIVLGELDKFEAQAASKADQIEKQVLIDRHGVHESSQKLSKLTNHLAQDLKSNWRTLWERITVLFRDGVQITGKLCDGCDHGGNTFGGVIGKVIQGAGVKENNYQWSEAWRRKLVDQGGDHFRVINKNGQQPVEQDELMRKARIMDGKQPRSFHTDSVARGELTKTDSIEKQLVIA